MSELQRRWAKAKLDALAAGGPGGGRLVEEEGEDDEPGGGGTGARGASSSNLSGGSVLDDDGDGGSSASSASSASSTGTIVPSASQKLFARPLLARGRTLDPIPWTTFFERELFLDAGDGSGVVYHAYLTSPVGGGPLFVMHHGAGSSGLSFAVVGAEIRKRLPAAGILSLDARDHGLTRAPPLPAEDPGGPGDSDAPGAPASAPPDLRLRTLSSDLLAVIRLAQAHMHWPELPPLVLVGHSLGGAVVTDLAFSGQLDPAAGLSPLLAFAVLDVVEGSAMDALQSMQTYLGTRPPGFPTLQAGIEWHIRSRTLRNATSARTSVPALLVDDGRGDGAAAGAEDADPPGAPLPPKRRRPWRWRTNLGATQPFWEDWFVGLSKKFLGARGGKLLLLAGTDRLDTELTIGQMQGKYALQVFPEAGHFIHEDLPEKTAATLVDFYHRNNRSALVLPPKVSELLAQGKKV